MSFRKDLIDTLWNVKEGLRKQMDALQDLIDTLWNVKYLSKISCGILILILSRLVDTFFSRISLTMPLPPKFHNTAYVLLWEEDLHWQSRSSGCSSS